MSTDREQLRDRIADTLYLRWLERATAKLAASPEDHCTDLADQVMGVVSVEIDRAVAAGRRQAAVLESIVREAACVTGETVTDWQRGYADCSARVLAAVDSWAGGTPDCGCGDPDCGCGDPDCGYLEVVARMDRWAAAGYTGTWLDAVYDEPAEGAPAEPVEGDTRG